MKNIFKVFATDVKRISTNVVAVVIIMGLCILPSLYAWFNILSNWDPYGPDATKNLKIAVFSEDTGMEYAGMEINVGSSVIDGLKENTTIGWVFTDSKEDAVEGVNSGEFYAALVIPTDFSKEMLSFISGELIHPEIEYYENEKKNAIAPKITAKAKTAVQEEINSSFVGTLTEVAMQFSNALVNADNQLLVFDKLTEKLELLDSQLNTYISIMDSFIGVTNAITSVIDTTNAIIPDMNAMLENGEASIDSMQGSISAGSATVNTVSVMIDYSLSAINQSLDNVETLIGGNIDTAEGLTDDARAKLIAAKAVLPYVTQMVEQLEKEITGEALIKEIDLGEDVSAEVDNTKKSISKIETDIDNILSNAEAGTESFENLQDEIATEIKYCKTSLNSVRDTYDLKVRPAVNNTLNSMENALTTAMNEVGKIHADLSGVTNILTEYQTVTTLGKGSLLESKNQALEVEKKLSEMIAEMNSLKSDENFQEFQNMFLTNPKQLASFVESPVLIDTQPMYAIKNYGSAMAPFYTILALWVGSLILVAILKVKVIPAEDCKNLKAYQKYFGRYIIFYLIGQVQALITVVGNIKYIGIQCNHPILLWFAASMCSFVFSILIYSLTVAFENVGEALAVVVMVIQVAGAGGTFPIEVLPKVYQAIYRFLPFTYGMNAMKEAIAGMYKNDYWKSMGCLLLFAGISIFIGLVLAIPFRRMNHKIEKSKEETEVML